ncbi:major facilitator superfamily transporter [Delitschia confertaspora ATCC 74209]|uniref:Major facilitator superfamily transporter n=1 Tax=Delitschia confertaspora ATCC 74209 TaxID=1513339 RepID=A0A9P4MN55_9PLEO|nr:major facilitator superfamily transporter [Delitschia confertaspora ATCC 74209]
MHSNERNSATPKYPSTLKLTVILTGIYICIFLVALDRTILGTAIPKITDEFHSIADIGWYGSAYMLTSCSFILLYGRIYTFFSTKYTFLFGVLIFEIGSAICGAAPSSTVLIIGRAIAGLGSSGIFTGAIVIILHTVPLHRRPLLQGLFGACFGVASVAGPLLGGAFTESKATWRWCFYINLPLGAFTVAVCVLFLKIEDKKPELGWKEKLLKLDPLGTVLFLPSIICLLLALQWGGTDMAWSDGRIISLLVAFAVLFVAFVALQYWTRNTTATVPARILLQRSISFGGLYQFFVGAAMLTVSIYLPLWFQAIKGVSAMKSGIDTIPLVLSVVVGSIGSGGVVQRVGYYTQFMFIGSVLMAVGTGLLTTWMTTTGHAKWIGHQVIFGLGVGSSMQQANLAVQTVLKAQDVPTGTSIMAFCQTMGGAIFLSVGQNLFMDKFVGKLWEIRGLDPGPLINAGATALKTAAAPEYLPEVLEAYNYGIVRGPFFASLIVACLTLIGALGMEWRSVKEGMPGDGSTELNARQDEESTVVGADRFETEAQQNPTSR